MALTTPLLLKAEAARQKLELLEFELGRLRHEQQETTLQLTLARARRDEIQRQLADGSLYGAAAIRESLQLLELTITRHEQIILDLKQKAQDQMEQVIAARKEADRAQRRSTADLERLLNQPTLPDTSSH